MGMPVRGLVARDVTRMGLEAHNVAKRVLNGKFETTPIAGR